MGKYTTEVRYICEIYAGLDESVGFDSIDNVINNSYDKIFETNKIPMFNGETEAHRTGLLKKILLHYYTREIGYETVGLWKLKLNQKLIEIMPYYNQLYESELITFDPLKNVNVTKTHEGEFNNDEKVDNVRDSSSTVATSTERDIVTDYTENSEENYSSNEAINLIKGVTSQSTQESDTSEDTVLRHSKTTTQGDDTRTNSVTSNGEKWTLFSDTPQGGINGIANASSGSVSDNTYLTNATHEITTPDEQSVTDQHGNIVETYNADGDKIDTITGHADVETNSTENTTSTTSTNKTADTTTEKTSNTTTNDKTDSTTNSIGNITDDNSKNTNGTDEYTNNDIGKIGTETYSEMLEKYRKTFLNIDLMVIKELEPLFIGLW